VEELPRSLIHPDKYRLRQYLFDEPDPELRRIFHLIRLQHRTSNGFKGMDQKSIVLYLNRKGWMARVIHDDLAATLGEEALAYSTVMKSLRVARINPRDATPLSDATSLQSTIQTKLSSEPLKNSRSLQFGRQHESTIHSSF
jgi:hypothetical protein